MLRICQIIQIIFITYMSHTQAHVLEPRPDYDFTDWRYVEALAEEHPYVVALLNKHEDIQCAGAIVSVNSVVTSGTCASRDPYYVAVGVAIIRHNALNKNGLFDVKKIMLPTNYQFHLILGQPNQTVIENNIGLVITKKSVITTAFGYVDMSNLYASELVNKLVASIGYTAIYELQGSVLSKQWYHEAMCLNLKWYYCMCGFEFATSKMAYYRLGEGGPVVLEDDIVVGVTTFPSGRMITPKSGLKFNVFTITAPYKSWLSGNTEPQMEAHRLTSNCAPISSNKGYQMYLKVLLMFLASKVLV